MNCDCGTPVEFMWPCTSCLELMAICYHCSIDGPWNGIYFQCTACIERTLSIR